MAGPQPRTLTRDEILEISAEVVRGYLHKLEEQVIMGRPPSRTFVCQGCGEAHAVSHGNRLICGCGATSAAEVMP